MIGSNPLKYTHTLKNTYNKVPTNKHEKKIIYFSKIKLWKIS